MLRGILVIVTTLAMGCGALLGLDDYEDGEPTPGSGGAATGGTGGSGGSTLDSEWSIRFGEDGTTVATSVAVAANGSIVVVGTFDGAIKLNKPYAVSGEHVFVTKIDGATGIPVWSHIYDVGGSTKPRVATAPGTAIYVTGVLHKPVDFGGELVPHRGAGDIFLLSLSEAGAHQRSESWGTQGMLAKDFVGDIQVLPDGDILLCGSYGDGDTGVFSMGGATFQSYTVPNAFVVRLQSDFSEDWIRTPQPASGGISACHSLALGSTGLFAAGTFTYGMTLDDVTITGTTVPGVVVASLDEAGTLVWASGFANDYEQSPPSLAVDGKGDPLLAGKAQGVINYLGTVDDIGSASQWLSLVSFLNSSEEAQAGMSFGTGDGELAVAAQGPELFVAGRFAGSVLGPREMQTQSMGAGDVVLARAHVDFTDMIIDALATAGDERDQGATDIAVDTNSVIVVGSMEGTMNLGGQLEAKGDRDAFVAKLRR